MRKCNFLEITILNERSCENLKNLLEKPDHRVEINTLLMTQEILSVAIHFS